MKPTQITELFANIKKTFVSFFSILMFVALGVGIFLGISWAGPALQSAANAEFDEGSFHHFQVQYPYGLTDEDVARIAGVDGVSDIEPTRQSFQTIIVSDAADQTVKVQTLAERIDVPTVIEGELPARANEIALNETAANRLGYAVGDTITFAKDSDGEDGGGMSLLSADDDDGGEVSASQGTASRDDDGMKYLNGSTYKVTALVKSPEYIALGPSAYGLSSAPSGSIDLLAWVPASAFDASAFMDGYPVVNIACERLEGLSMFTDEYKDKSAEIEKRITDAIAPLAEARFDDLRGKAKQRIDDAEKQLEEARQKIADGERQLAEGRQELDAKRAEGEARLAEGYETLMYYEGLKAEGEAKISQAKQILAAVDELKAAANAAVDEYADRWSKAATEEEKQRIVDDAQRELDELFAPWGLQPPTITVDNFEAGMAEARAALAGIENTPVPYDGEVLTIAEWRKRLADAEEQFNTAVAQLDEGWAMYYAGWDELNARVAEGEQKLADGQEQVDEAKEKVAENEPKLEEAKRQFSAMEHSTCAAMSRAYNAGAAQVATLSSVTDNLSFSMAALFIIVGLLVSYSAVSRIVHEQITQIGTKKALGLRFGEITTSFLAYSGLATIVGAVIGVIMGVLLVEGIIGHVLGGMFVFGDYPAYFGPVLFLVVTVLELALVLVATYQACRGILREHAVELLKGEKPPEGKTRFYEKWGVWDKLSLLTQTIVNNCVNDKRRVFSTVVGVAGCTALIVTAITLNNDVLKSYTRHYEDVYGFNAIVYVDSSAEGAIENVDKALEQQGASTAVALRKSFVLDQPDGERGVVRVIVPMDEGRFAGVYSVNPVRGGAFDSRGEGVWVSQAYAEHFGADVGDTITFEDSNGRVYEAPIAGVHEFWLTYHEVVMGRDYYEKLLGETLEPNVVLANTRETGVDEVGQALMSVEGFDSILDDKEGQYSNFRTFSRVSSAVVLIYMVLSVLMAIVVLLNLNFMFIEEKKRDLIVLMINGFSVKDAKRYIYNDTIALTVVGVVLGVLLGCIMGSITVMSIEPSAAAFVKSPDLMAVLIGILDSVALSFIMSFIALRRIPKFNLTDINKL